MTVSCRCPSACVSGLSPACICIANLSLTISLLFVVVVPDAGEEAKKLRPVLDAIHERSTGNLRVRVNDGREITATATDAVDVSLAHIGVVLFYPKTVVSAVPFFFVRMIFSQCVVGVGALLQLAGVRGHSALNTVPFSRLDRAKEFRPTFFPQHCGV